jgi:hypothetical protein
MSSEKKVLLVDFGAGIVFLASSVFFVSSTVEWWVISAIIGHTAVFATALYMSEHNETLVPLVILCTQMTITVLFTVTNGPIAAGMEVSLFVGIALGILGYRFAYGVLQPIPQKRLQQVSQQTSNVLFFR